jgi:hypothetical protein
LVKTGQIANENRKKNPNDDIVTECNAKIEAFRGVMQKYAIACILGCELEEELKRTDGGLKKFIPKAHEALGSKEVRDLWKSKGKGWKKKLGSQITGNAAAYNCHDDEDDCTHSLETSGDFCQCGPHTIPVPGRHV